MFSPIKIFLLQTKRNGKQLMLQLVLLCVVAAFFVVSLNLYSNSMKNLQTVDDTYITIATAEFYGYVNEAGELVTPGDESCVGRHWLSVDGYDLSPFLALDFVKGIDLRTRVGAYIPGHIQVYRTMDNGQYHQPDYMILFSCNNTIRFVLDSEVPMTFPLLEEQQLIDFPIRILEQSNTLLEYPDVYKLIVSQFSDEKITQYADDIRRLNRSDATHSITLYPGTEYVMKTDGGDYWGKNPDNDRYIWQEDYKFDADDGITQVRYDGIAFSVSSGSGFYASNSLCYGTNGLYSTRTALPGGPFPMQRYEDVRNDPIWTEYVQAAEYTGGSFNVTLTEDISLVPAWHQGAMYLNEGRMITEEEYASGAKVCMISATMAVQQGWQVGDTLDMHLYAYDGFRDQTQRDFTTNDWHLYPPSYSKNNGGFFEEDTYEIVGIFGRKELEDLGDTAQQVFFNPRDAIYIPANAAPDAPTGPIQPSLLTFHLKNGQIGAFKQAVEEMGLTEVRTGQYEIKFSYFDQGYSKIADALAEMNRNAILLLNLSALLLLVTMILMAFLFSRQHKHSAGILRMLGGSKKQAFAAILTCAAAVVAAGGTFGTIVGGVLTQSVGASILGSAAESAKVALSTGASPVLTMLSGIGCMVLFLVLTAIFTGTYIGQEPRALLPEDKN